MAYKKYNMFHLPLFSFFSKKLYRDIAQNWKGANFAYLFLLLAICWIPSTLRLREDLLRSIDSSKMHLISQLPDIHIEDGHVTVDQQKPLFIKNLEGQTVAIIDTTGSMNYIDNDTVKVLLTDSGLIFRRGKKHFNTLDLSQVSEFHLSQQTVNQWLQSTRSSLAPLSYGLFLLLSYIFAVLVMLLAAVVGLILSAIMRSTMKFAAVLRVAVAATTPVIILVTISTALNQSVPWLAYIAFTLLYLLIGIISGAKAPKEQEIPHLKLADLIDKSKVKPIQNSQAA